MGGIGYVVPCGGADAIGVSDGVSLLLQAARLRKRIKSPVAKIFGGGSPKVFRVRVRIRFINGSTLLFAISAD